MSGIRKAYSFGLEMPLAVANFRKAILRSARRRFWRSTPKLTSHPEVPSVLIAYNEFGAYCIPRSSIHRAICQTVLSGRVWEKEIIAFMASNSKGGDIIHAGAYFGDFLPPLSKSLDGAQKIWAFEPLAESHRCAEVTIALNGLPNVELVQAALGSSPGLLRFTTHDASGRSLGGESRADPLSGTETVSRIRLDDVIPSDRRVSILQLDVEGSEAEAISGARQIIERDRPIVILESVPSDFAANHGYAFVRELDDNSIFQPI